MASNTESDPFLKKENGGNGLGKPYGIKHCGLTRSWFPNLLASKLSNVYWIAALVFFITSLLWGLILLYASRQIPHFTHYRGDYGAHSKIYGISISEYKFLKCGTSVDEAKALGCEYDILTNHWVPKQCIDRDAVKEYQSDESWYGYARENRTELLSLDTMGELPVYYTSERDHIVHCAMLWRRQYKAFSEGRKNIDSVTADPEHTYHCSQYLMDMTDRGVDFRGVPLEVHVGFAGCFFGD